MKFSFDATGIGSIPLKDPKEASELILSNFRTVPFWPQLPRRSFYENMYVQYSEGLPGLVIDDAAKTIHIDTSKVATEFETAYSKYLDGDTEYFRISEQYAAGFYRFLEILAAPPKGMTYAKGHITGPISYALQLTTETKKAVIHDRDLFEVLTKTLVMKVRWQVRKMKRLFPAVIIFIDEPYLVSIGSSYININLADAVAKLDEVIAAIREEGALAGLHCCGNTDWSLILKRDLDILNFDSYNFMKEFLIYSADIKAFLAKGGTIAWGVVPSSEAIETESPKSLAVKLKGELSMLAEKGIPKGSISSLVTPSCGVGSLDEGIAKKVLESARQISEILQK